jgi:hypothetical protein
MELQSRGPGLVDCPDVTFRLIWIVSGMLEPCGICIVPEGYKRPLTNPETEFKQTKERLSQRPNEFE